MDNPLLIDLVLHGVFEHLQVEVLKECRAVCSLWNTAVLSSSSWKQGVKVCVRSGGGGGQTVDTFWKLVEVGNGTCFSEMYSILVHKISQTFLSHCGTRIKILRLRRITFESKEEFQTVVYKACPNMEQLSLYHIVIRRIKTDQADDYFEARFGEKKNMKYLAVHLRGAIDGVLCVELLSHFPNLEAFHLLDELPANSFPGVLASFNRIRENFPEKFKLKHITCATPGPEFLQILKDPGLELQTINTEYCCKPDDLREVLSIHASSLKKLRFNGYGGSRTIVPNEVFPLHSAFHVGLDALQVLKVGNAHFFSMEILKFTPNLRMLEITGFNDTLIENTQISEMGEISLKKCKRLIVNYFYTLSLESLRKLVTLLPNVEELELSRLTNAHFQMICESWPSLVALVSRRATVDDMGISGYDKMDVDKINDNGESSFWRPITVPRANVSALKDLRSLYISGPDGIPKAEIGYCAAVCGVELVPKLERLYFNSYNLKGSIWKRLEFRFPKANERLREFQDLSDAYWF